MRHSLLLAAVFAANAPCPSAAQGVQRFADLGRCPTLRGEMVDDCRVGFRIFGRLNEARDNAVVVPTWYGGRSETMAFLLGPEGWIDTTRYFAIFLDAPGNGVSISPSTSRRQPGARFPRLGLEDMVSAQHRVVTEVLRLRRLHAVVGWSMGGMQAIAWAQRYPESVGRVVSVAGTPRMGTYDLYWVRGMLTLLDLGRRAALPPDTLALKLAELWHTVGSTPSRENLLARDSVDTMLAAESRVEWLPLAPEDNRVQLEALAAFDAFGTGRRGEPGGVPMLLLFVPDDHVTTAESFREFAAITGADTIAYPSRCGHMAPVCDQEGVGRRVAEYLDSTLETATR